MHVFSVPVSVLSLLLLVVSFAVFFLRGGFFLWNLREEEVEGRKVFESLCVSLSSFLLHLLASALFAYPCCCCSTSRLSFPLACLLCFHSPVA